MISGPSGFLHLSFKNVSRFLSFLQFQLLLLLSHFFLLFDVLHILRYKLFVFLLLPHLHLFFGLDLIVKHDLLEVVLLSLLLHFQVTVLDIDFVVHLDHFSPLINRLGRRHPEFFGRRGRSQCS